MVLKLAAGWMIVRAPVHWTALLALITPLTLYTLAIGQTAVLTTAGLFFLMGAGGERNRPDGVGSPPPRAALFRSSRSRRSSPEILSGA
jgi:hypothetical protein